MDNKVWGKSEVEQHAIAVAMWEAMTVETEGERFNWDEYRREAGCSCDDGKYCKACLTVAVADQREVCQTKEAEWENRINPNTSNKRRGELEQGWENMYVKTIPTAIQYAVLILNRV